MMLYLLLFILLVGAIAALGLGMALLNPGQKVQTAETLPAANVPESAASDLPEKREKAFVDGIMHEVRHPLMMARNISAMLDKDRLAPEEREFIEASEQSLNELSVKLERIHLGAQWQSGQRTLSLESHRLSDWQSAVLHEVPPVKMKLDPALKDRLYRFDLAALTLAAVEVIQNGLRFNQAAKPQVEIEVLAVRDRVRFLFQDNGVGMDMADWERVFDLMVVLDAARQFKGHRAGVGLTIAKGVVTAHGGEIRVFESSEAGTVIAWELPLVRV